MLKKQIRIAIGSTALICSLGYTTGAFAVTSLESVTTSETKLVDFGQVKTTFEYGKSTVEFAQLLKEIDTIKAIQANNNAISAYLKKGSLNKTAVDNINKLLKSNKDTAEILTTYKKGLSTQLKSFETELNSYKGVASQSKITSGDLYKKVNDFIKNNTNEKSISKTIANLKTAPVPKGISANNYNALLNEFDNRSALIKDAKNISKNVSKLQTAGNVIKGFGAVLDVWTLGETGVKLYEGTAKAGDIYGGISAATALLALTENPVLVKINLGLTLAAGIRENIKNGVGLISLLDDQRHYTEAMKTDKYLNALQMKQYYEAQIKYTSAQISIELIKISNAIEAKNEALIDVSITYITNLIKNLSSIVEKDRDSIQGYTEELSLTDSSTYSLAALLGYVISDESHKSLEEILKLNVDMIAAQSKFLLWQNNLINTLADTKNSSQTITEIQSEQPTTPVIKPTPAPALPAIALKGTFSDAQVTLTWNKPENTINQVICYSPTKLSAGFDCFTDGGFDITRLDNQNSPVVINNLTNGKKYYFVVEAENADGRFANSNLLTATPKAIATATFPKTGYTKIANDGSKLADSANLGANPKDWACTRDNKTGLIWEVKTTDGGLRDMNNYYSWYEPDANKNGGFAGYPNGAKDYCKGSDCDTYAFTNAVNTQSLCGAKDWRVPNNEELKGLVYCSDNQTKTLGKEESGYICTGSPTRPTINTTYFPNTQSNWFWSSSPNASHSDLAWIVYFVNGFSLNGSKYYNGYVRLVR
jgi:hypothetical protein